MVVVVVVVVVFVAAVIVVAAAAFVTVSGRLATVELVVEPVIAAELEVVVEPVTAELAIAVVELEVVVVDIAVFVAKKKNKQMILINKLINFKFFYIKKKNRILFI